MVGREIGDIYPELSGNIGAVVMEAEGLSSGKLRGVSMDLREGEILGIAGIAGAGRSALVETILGMNPLTSGSLRFKGKPAVFRNIRQAIEAGFCYIHSDRKNKGIIAPESRITSYNVCYTKLLRYIFRLAVFCHNAYCCEHIVHKVRIHLGLQRQHVITSYSIHYTKLYEVFGMSRGRLYDDIVDFSAGRLNEWLSDSEKPEDHRMEDRVDN